MVYFMDMVLGKLQCNDLFYGYGFWVCYNVVLECRFDYSTLRALQMCDLHMEVSLIGGVLHCIGY